MYAGLAVNELLGVVNCRQHATAGSLSVVAKYLNFASPSFCVAKTLLGEKQLFDLDDIGDTN